MKQLIVGTKPFTRRRHDRNRTGAFGVFSFRFQVKTLAGGDLDILFTPLKTIARNMPRHRAIAIHRKQPTQTTMIRRSFYYEVRRNDSYNKKRKEYKEGAR